MKIKILLVFLFVALISFPPLNAQWARIYSGDQRDNLQSAKLTSDGGCIALGWTNSFGVAVESMWIVKVDSFGKIEWQRTYGGDDWDEGHDIQETTDGGYIAVGQTQSFGAGNHDFWILKLNSSGHIEWQHTYGGPEWDGATSVHQTNDGGFIVAGNTRSFGAGLDDVWILKLDSSGQIEWQFTYGGIMSERLKSIRQTRDGGYIVASSSYSFGPGPLGIWIQKITSAGQSEWQNCYGGIDSDSVRAIQETTDGGYIVLCRTYSFGAGLSDYLVLKLDASGNITWQRTFGGALWDTPQSVHQTSDGGYVLAGNTYSYGAGDSDCYILKLDSTGNVEWEHVYGGPGYDSARFVQQTADGGYIVAGTSTSFGSGDEDFMIFKISSEGKIDLSCGTAGFIIGNSNSSRMNPVSAACPAFILPSSANIGYHSTNISPVSTDIQSQLLCAKKKKGGSIR
ncbi:hypothetical protein ACFLT2_12740 [Acidobacteriota bacterium]